MPATAPEIDAAAFEAELRAGNPVAVLDVRDTDAFTAWHLTAPAATVVNRAEHDVTDDVEGPSRRCPSTCRCG